MRFYKWTVEIEVADSIVADGFDLTHRRLKDILERALPYTRSTETQCRVLAAPDSSDLNVEQGYASDAVRKS